MREYRSFDTVKEEYLLKNPEEIDDFLAIVFEEYANDRDSGALLASLRSVSRVKGITAIAEKAGISRNGVQKALSSTGNPKFESINSIMHAIGYSLMPQRLESRLHP